MEKKKKVILLTNENANENIPKILLGTEIDFLVVLFFGKNSKENEKLLEITKKYFNTRDKNSYLKDVVIISQREYLANDLMVEAVIKPADIQKFRYFEFVNRYENCEYESVSDFILSCSDILEYEYDLYNEKDPWIYRQNKTGVLILSDNTHEKILNNYHKIKCTIPQIIVSIFDGKNDWKLIKLLKLIGSDAELIVTFINNLAVPYCKRTDVFIYVEGEDFRKTGIDFINDILYYTEYPDGIKILKKYMEIPDKNFDPDIFYDEDRELENKTEKYYKLHVEQGGSLRREISVEGNTLSFNIGLQKKYIVDKYQI